MHTREVFTVLALATTTSLFAAQRDWKTATLVEIDRPEPDRHISQTYNGRIVESADAATQSYTFDLGDRIAVCVDMVPIMLVTAVQVAVGSQIRYARDGTSRLIFLDSKGKERKCIIRHEALKPTPAP
jgi:hypothetical protein